MSPLSQGRGLKRGLRPMSETDAASPLSQGRGLKHFPVFSLSVGALVAPFTGAWIETVVGVMGSPGAMASPLSQGRGLKQL